MTLRLVAVAALGGLALATAVHAATPAAAPSAFRSTGDREAASVAVAPPLRLAGLATVLPGDGGIVPLNVALRQIIPPSIRYKVDRSINQKQLVSWHGGRAWTSILADLVASVGLNAELRPDNTIWIRPKELVTQAAPAATALPLSEAAPAATPAASAAAPEVDAPPAAAPRIAVSPPTPLAAPTAAATAIVAPAAPPTPLAAPPSRPILAPAVDSVGQRPLAAALSAQAVEKEPLSRWEIREHTSLHSTLEAWATGMRLKGNVDWRIVWQSEYDYPIQKGGILEGSFESAAATLLHSFAHASPPIEAHFKPNHVIVVKTPADEFGGGPTDQ